jgi:hypothetical protein
MEPDVWGPHYWFVLHTIAFNYPKYPTPVQKKIHYRLVHNLHEFLPSGKDLFLRILVKHPVQPYLDTRDDFIKWMNLVHNEVNLTLKKSVFTLDDHYARIKDLQTPQHSKLQRFLKARRWLLYLLFIFMLLAVAYMLTR